MAIFGPHNYLKPLGRQPIYPGTHRRLGGINVFPGSVQYTQNNFFGGNSFGMSGMYSGFGGGWGYGGDCCGGGSSNKLMNWMFGLGMTGMIGGFVCNLIDTLRGGGGGGSRISADDETEYVSTTTKQKPEVVVEDDDENNDEVINNKLKDAFKKSFDNSGLAAKHGLNDGDVEVGFDNDGNAVYKFGGKEYSNLVDLQKAIEAAKTAAEADKIVNNTPENEITQNRGRVTPPPKQDPPVNPSADRTGATLVVKDHISFKATTAEEANQSNWLGLTDKKAISEAKDTKELAAVLIRAANRGLYSGTSEQIDYVAEQLEKANGSQAYGQGQYVLKPEAFTENKDNYKIFSDTQIKEMLKQHKEASTVETVDAKQKKAIQEAAFTNGLSYATKWHKEHNFFNTSSNDKKAYNETIKHYMDQLDDAGKKAFQAKLDEM